MKTQVIKMFSDLFIDDPELDDVESMLTKNGYSFEYKWVDTGTIEHIWVDPITAADNEKRGIMTKMFCDLYQDGERFVFVAGRIGNTLDIVFTKEA